MPGFQQNEEQPLISYPFLFSVLIPLLLIFTITPALIKWLSNAPTSKKNQPPSPPKLPIIGNFHQLTGSTSLHGTLRSLARNHGPIMLLHLGRVPTLIISSADGAREIMKTHDIVFSNRPKSTITERLLYNYKDVSTAPYGDLWRQLKSIFVLQLLSNKRVQSFQSVRAEETALLMKKIRESSSLSLPVNLSEMFCDLANDITCRAALGRKYGEGEKGMKVKQLLRDLLLLLGYKDLGSIFPWLAWVNWVNGFDAEVGRVSKELDEFLEGILEDRMYSSKAAYQSNGTGRERREVEEGRRDFFDILLGICKDELAGMSIGRDSIKALILDVFAAGTDTTSTFLEWVMAELLRHSEVMKKLKNEVRDILNGKPEIGEDDLEKMHYLKAVIKETLRLHPPFPLLVPREAREDVKVMSYDIAAGTQVLINGWAIGRDPASWDRPEEFDPERFVNSSIDFKGHDFQLIPFGAGRRGCPGIAFSMAINELVLATLVHNFNWALPVGANGEAEDLDMSEGAGITTHKRIPLSAVAKVVA